MSVIRVYYDFHHYLHLKPITKNSLTVKAEPQDIIINECEKSLSKITMEIKAEAEGKTEQDVITKAVWVHFSCFRGKFTKSMAQSIAKYLILNLIP